MGTREIVKALEVWTLQNLLNFSIMLGLLTLALALMQDYYRQLEKRLTLRVTIELWRVLTVLVVDVFLTIVVLIGYVVLNPDIMADIKMAVPFCPVATVLFAVALVLRIFHGGHEPGTPNYYRALYALIAANAVNIVGFTIVMEAPSGEYLERHPSAFWDFVKTHLRSNAVPNGLELAQITFYVCFTALILVLVWGLVSGLKAKPGAREE